MLPPIHLPLDLFLDLPLDLPLDLFLVLGFLFLSSTLIKLERKNTSHLYTQFTKPRVFKGDLAKSNSAYETYLKELAAAHSEGKTYQYPDWFLRAAKED